ncbi:hypothetical protein N2152v2_007677 [Parachlorella kessleri]
MLRRSTVVAGRIARQLSAGAVCSTEGAAAEAWGRGAALPALELFDRWQQGSTWGTSAGLPSHFSNRFFSCSPSRQDEASDLASSAAASAAVAAPLPDLSQILDPATIVQAAIAGEANAFQAAALDVWLPTRGIQELLILVHDATGLEWWDSIVATTFGVRLLTFPVMLFQIKNTYKLSQARPEVEKLVEWMKDEQARGNPNAVSEYQQRVAAIYKKHDCNPLKSMASVLIQLPVFVGFFSALRGFAEVKVPSLVEGGAFWFPDLTVADPYYLLPVLSSLTFLLTVELGAETGMEGQPEQTRKRMKMVMRFLALIMIPFTMNMPAGVFCYWTASNLFSLVQSLFIKIPSVKKVLGLPDLKTAHLSKEAKLVGKPVVTLSHRPPKGRSAKAAASAARIEQALDRAAAKSR